jgi:hypothetical protein
MTASCAFAAAAALAAASVVLGEQTPAAGQDVHRRAYSLGNWTEMLKK